MKSYDILFLYLQEHWLPHHEAQKTLMKDFPRFHFLTTSSDMFSDPEDLAMKSGPVWHGTAIGWPVEIDSYFICKHSDVFVQEGHAIIAIFIELRMIILLSFYLIYPELGETTTTIL